MTLRMISTQVHTCMEQWGARRAQLRWFAPLAGSALLRARQASPALNRPSLLPDLQSTCIRAASIGAVTLLSPSALLGFVYCCACQHDVEGVTPADLASPEGDTSICAAVNWAAPGLPLRLPLPAAWGCAPARSRLLTSSPFCRAAVSASVGGYSCTAPHASRIINTLSTTHRARRSTQQCCVNLEYVHLHV